jgi:hypothetical protein
MLLHCVDLTFSTAFTFCVQLRLVFTLVLLIANICTACFSPTGHPQVCKLVLQGNC